MKTLTKVACLLTLSAILLAIASPALASQPLAAPKKLRVGIAPPADSEFYQLIKKGAMTCGGDQVELLWQTPTSHQAVEEQQRIIEAWINQKLDAIAVTTVGDLSAMDELFKRGTEAGIKMYFLNMAEPQLEPVDRAHFESSVGYNNYEAAKLLGQWVTENLGKKGKIAVLLGTPGVHANDRLRGFQDGLTGTEWTIVTQQEADWVRDKGQSVAESILQANPDLSLIYGENDEMALGALQAVQDRGLKDKVAVVGLDGVKAALDSIKEGGLTASMNVIPREMGCQLLNDIVSVANGGSVPKIHDIKVHVTDKTNVFEDMRAFGRETKLRVGIAPPADSEFYQLIKKGALTCGGDEVELLWQTPTSHQAVEEQQRIIEAWINQKLDAIAVTTVGDLSAMDELFKRGTEAGIKMYFLNMAEPQLEPVDRAHFESSVGYNNYEAAKLLGQWVTENLGKKGKIAVLLGTPGVHANDRLRGFQDGLTGTEWTIVTQQEADWVRDKGQSVAESILQANPDLSLIYGENDEMALGALQAVQDRGLKDKVAVVGLDGVKAALDSIKEGGLTASMNVIPREMGCQLLNDIVIVANGGPVPKIHDIKVHVTDKTTVDEDMKAFQ